MELATTQHDHATVIAIQGRLDGLTASTLETAVDEQLAAGRTRLVFDGAGLDYISSAGLRVLLTAAKKARSAGGDCTFAALSPAVVEVFKLSGFDGLFTLHDNVAAAVADLA